MYKSETSAYRSIFKATSLFGGVQVYNILISVIKSKFVAVLLGTNGVGILGLYHSSLMLIYCISSMGLSTSAVRNIAEASNTGDNKRIGFVISVLRKLVWLTGLLGLIIVIVLSPILSVKTFGNYDYTVPFIVLSITLLVDQIAAGQKVILQGLRHLKDLAKASALGATAGLLLSIPLYYLLGVDGIVPTLLLNSLTMVTLTWYYAKKHKIEKVSVSVKQAILEGKDMLNMGIAMSIANVLSLGCAYFIRSYINHAEGLEVVGLYSAGFAIINTYVGMVFSAMSTDYYPRLAAAHRDRVKCSLIVNQQGEIASLILTPMLVCCIAFLPIVIKILYSDAFLPANEFILYSCPGMFFKLGSWLLTYMLIAHGDSKIFIACESLSNMIFFILNIIGFDHWGLKGIGVTFSIGYLIYFILMFIICHLKYAHKFSRTVIFMFILQLSLIVFSLLCECKCFDFSHKTFILLGLLSISCIYSLVGLYKRLKSTER